MRRVDADPVDILHSYELRDAMGRMLMRLHPRQRVVVENDFEWTDTRLPDRALAKLCNTTVSGLAEIRNSAHKRLQKKACLLQLAHVLPDSYANDVLLFIMRENEEKL